MTSDDPFTFGDDPYSDLAFELTGVVKAIEQGHARLDKPTLDHLLKRRQHVSTEMQTMLQQARSKPTDHERAVLRRIIGYQFQSPHDLESWQRERHRQWSGRTTACDAFTGVTTGIENTITSGGPGQAVFPLPRHGGWAIYDQQDALVHFHFFSRLPVLAGGFRNRTERFCS